MRHSGKLALRLALALSIASGAAGGLIVKYADQLHAPSYAAEVREAQAAKRQLSSEVEHARGLSDAFISVAKTVRPSVVQISSTVRAQPVSGKQRIAPQIPKELRERFGLNEDDFGDFFNQQPHSGGRDQHGQGTGVIISSDGYIVTNNHVVRGASLLTVRLSDGREFTGKVIGQDEKTDVAVIKIQAKDLLPVELGSSDAVQVGEWVLAIGSPFGLDQTVTAGIISAKGRANVGITDYEDFLQTDAAINPGNSGGPLVNMQGEVVGINTAIASRSGGSMGVGFAIPSNMVKMVANSLMKEGKVTRGWLGAAIQDLNEDLAKSFEYASTKGVLVGDVVPGSPAAKAGLQAGDIVVKLNGQEMQHASQLRHAVAAMTPDTQTDLQIFRAGKTQSVPVVIGRLDASSAVSVNSPEEESEEATTDALGVTVQDLNAELAKQLGLQKVQSGVVVTNVESDSLAEQAGVQAGDVIASIGGQAVQNVAEYRAALQKHSVEQGVRVQVSRDGVSRFVFLRTNR
ncbi:MAG TPA: DegQ family serine endoprotease [Pirellulaceae bacterium]|nr:DegQ family serine endoprotease [Pirellulaceae bacterium]